jgi:hypothetical protein
MPILQSCDPGGACYEHKAASVEAALPSADCECSPPGSDMPLNAMALA